MSGDLLPPYEVLGLPESSSQEEIQRAYIKKIQGGYGDLADITFAYISLTVSNIHSIHELVEKGYIPQSKVEVLVKGPSSNEILDALKLSTDIDYIQIMLQKLCGDLYDNESILKCFQIISTLWTNTEFYSEFQMQIAMAIYNNGDSDTIKKALEYCSEPEVRAILNIKLSQKSSS